MALQRIGIVGIGRISGIYLKNLTGMFGKRVKLSAVTDIVEERAKQAAEENNIRYHKTTLDLIKDPEVDIVLNLTQPLLHHEVSMMALDNGKHVYNEKPLCAKPEQAAELIEAAKSKKLRVGGAPDTFMGPGIQTCRKLIDDGWIGRPIAASAFMMNHGHEHWHPDPNFYYQIGGGPMFDMGPYYLTALVNLLGPITRVSGSAQISEKERVIDSEPLRGNIINVGVPTHIAGVMDFASGAVGMIVQSFDVWAHSMPFIELYGTEGSLQVPNPNNFTGEIKVRRYREDNWSTIPNMFAVPENTRDPKRDTGPQANNLRGIGLTDMAEAITEGRAHRASAELANHVLENMYGFHEASASGKYYSLKSTCERPEPLDYLKK